MRLSLSVALSAMSLLVFAESCREVTHAGVAPDARLQKFVSPDTQTLAGIDLDSLKSADFWKRHQQLLDTPLLDAAFKQAGLDLRRDVQQAIVTFNGKDFTLAILGHLRKAKIEAELAKNYGSAVHDGQTLFTARNIGIAVLSDELAITGPPRSVEMSIRARNNGSRLPEGLSPLLGELNNKDQLWVVSRRGLPLAGLPLRSDYASILSNFAGYIDSVVTGIAVDFGLHFKARITCLSEEGATRVDDTLRAGIGLVRLRTDDNSPDLMALYEAIHVSKEARTVNVFADISPDLADHLLGRAVRLDLPELK